MQNMLTKSIYFVVFLIAYVEAGILNLPEGSQCKWLNATGKCMIPQKCPSFELDIAARQYPPTCSFQDKKPIICCTDCYIPEAAFIRDTSEDRLSAFKSDHKYEENCMRYQYLLPYKCKTHVTRSIKKHFDKDLKCYDVVFIAVAPSESEDARRGDYPHMALLGYGDTMDSAQWLCGGSLISERHILTAAHCGAEPRLGPVRYVALGMLKRTDPPHYWRRYEVKLFYPHPEYRSPLKYHDIAIIETTTSVNLTDGVRPACLTHKLEFPGDDVAFATGWGSLGPGKENADVLQKVVVEKFTEAECRAQYPPHRHMPAGYNHTSQSCYGDRDGRRDTCQGDSGGPLQLRDYKGKFCIYAILGVISSGHACGAAGQAGLYTRVSHYLPWIESLLWP